MVTRTRPIQKLFCDEFNYQWFANDLEEPYTIPANMPFTWVGRLRVTGGRTVVWGRQSYRFSDLDFKAASHDGYGEDWPISYADLAPYYDRVEQYVGVSGLVVRLMVEIRQEELLIFWFAFTPLGMVAVLFLAHRLLRERT